MTDATVSGSAPTPAPPALDAQGEPALEAEEPKDKKKEDDDDLDFKGRVRMGVALDDRKLKVGMNEVDQDGLALELVEARIGADYMAMGWLSITIEADLTGSPELRDGFVRAESELLRGTFGQFKMPVSAMTLESPWKLPLADRGVIQDILVDHMQMMGRRQGATGRIRGPGKLKPELTLGMFQGWLANDNELIVPDFAVKKTIDSQNAIARLGAKLAGVEVGLVGERISTLVAMKLRHFWAAGIDATADYEFSGHGVRFWLEGFTGTTWQSQDGGAEHPKVQFGTGRAILAYRRGGMHKGEPYMEPFVMGGVLDPDLETHSDLVWEGSLGANAGFYNRFRFTIAGQFAGSDYGVPDQLFKDSTIRRQKKLELQVGAAF